MSEAIAISRWVCPWCGWKTLEGWKKYRHRDTCENRPAPRSLKDHRPHYNGVKILRLMRRMGYKTQVEFAREIHVHPITLSNFITGKTRSTGTAILIADELGVQIEDIQVRRLPKAPWPAVESPRPESPLPDLPPQSDAPLRPRPTYVPRRGSDGLTPQERYESAMISQALADRGAGPGVPTFETIQGRLSMHEYVVFRDEGTVLDVFSVQADGRLKRLKVFPKGLA